MNIWQANKKSIIGLAPMDGVTDFVFRSMVHRYSKPDVVYTEFVSVEGLTHGALPLLKDLIFSKQQRPVIAQVFGHTPKDFRTVAFLVCALGFDGIDINMGCPAKSVASRGGGAALIQTPKLAVKIIQQTKLGIQDWVDGKNISEYDGISQEIRDCLIPTKERGTIPISVKTRIGFQKPQVTQWISTLLSTKVSAIALHGRTFQQGYSGKANWEKIAQAKELAKNTKIKILGNGDVRNYSQARFKIQQYNVDGVLIGRAAFGNPWIFSFHTPTQNDRFQVAMEHAFLFEKMYKHLSLHQDQFNIIPTPPLISAITSRYSFFPMRKHLGWYMKDFHGAKALRSQLVHTYSAEEVKKILNNKIIH